MASRQPIQRPPAPPTAPASPPRLVDPAEELITSIHAAVSELRTTAEQVLTAGTQSAADKTTARVAFELPGAIDRMVRQRDRLRVLEQAAILVVFLLIGGLIGFWLRGMVG